MTEDPGWALEGVYLRKAVLEVKAYGEEPVMRLAHPQSKTSE